MAYTGRINFGLRSGRSCGVFCFALAPSGKLRANALVAARREAIKTVAVPARKCRHIPPLSTLAGGRRVSWNLAGNPINNQVFGRKLLPYLLPR